MQGDLRRLLVGVLLGGVYGVFAAVSIVLPERPTAVERTAAEELADGVRRMTGQSAPIVPEGTASVHGLNLHVGRTVVSRRVLGEKPNWRDDEIAVLSAPEGVVLDGHPQRGPLYAADVYLEDVCGVRWWTSTEADYPRLASLPMKELAIRHASPFKYRETYYLDLLDAAFKVRLKGNVTSRTKYVKRQPERIGTAKGGDSALHYFEERMSAYHSNLVILPPARHFAAHPEWYSLVKGERKPIQLCMTNPEMFKAYVASIKAILAAHPEADFIQVSQNDGRAHCECAVCRRAEEEEGLSGLYLGFANAVAAEVEKEFPHVTIDTFAYRFTRPPPKRIRPRHNVTVRLCDIECAFNAPIATSPLNTDFVRDLEGWRKIAAGRLYIWDYVTDFSACMVPHPNLHVLADNIRLFAQTGAVGVFEQGDATCRTGFMAPLMGWTIAHLLWNPARDAQQLMDEFLVGYYGPAAAPHLRQALSIVEAAGRRTAAAGEAVTCYHANVTNFMSRADALAFCAQIKAARAAAENPMRAQRVAREELTADLVRLLNWRLWELGTEAERRALFETWSRTCREMGCVSYREAYGDEDFEKCLETLSRGPTPNGVNTPKRKPRLASISLKWDGSGEAPCQVIDFGPDGVAGYPVLDVASVKGPAKVRLSYACVPDFGADGDFTRKTSARYLGKDVDLPILPANIDRFDVFTVTNTGIHAATLQQGLVRYVRVPLESPDTEVRIAAVDFANRGTHSTEPVVGQFACSDAGLTDLWRASVRTCTLAAIPARQQPLHLITPETNVVLGTTHAYLSDGAKRDRLVWSGDLWWAQLNMYAAFSSDSPYLPGSIRMLAENQTPAGYVQACPWPESHGPLRDGDYGPFQSDEFAAWFVPVLWTHYQHTGDLALVREFYPNVVKLLGYLRAHIREDGIFEQRAETSKHANGLAFGTSSTHHRAFMNVLLWRAFRDAAGLAAAMGLPLEASRWMQEAARVAAPVRARFIRPDGLLKTSLEDDRPGLEACALALGTGFCTAAEAKRMLAGVPRIGHGKFQMLLVRGAFAYGDSDEALRRIRQHNWLKTVDPAWMGVHTTSECMHHPTRANWGDECHPDTAIAGDLTEGLLGVVPTAPGYARIRFVPGAAKGIDWAKGVIPTPLG
ncbi:MAG: DUF4838 domain-containing protein, partial [Kiritimatiellae bacterium]|nr:DUF4838 domain-containing protein [Kiritimatiellia bacterium]